MSKDKTWPTTKQVKLRPERHRQLKVMAMQQNTPIFVLVDYLLEIALRLETPNKESKS